MTRSGKPAENDDRVSSTTGLQFSAITMPAGWKIVVETEESVVHYCAPRGETDSVLRQSSRIPGLTGMRASGWMNAAVIRGSDANRHVSPRRLPPSSRGRRATSGPWSTRQMMRTMSSRTHGP